MPESLMPPGPIKAEEPPLVDLTIDGPASGVQVPLSSAIPMELEYYSNQRVIVFTDGASRANQDIIQRRAGYGAWWGHGNPRNISQPLHGTIQTNQRAELQAVLH
eukprot:12414444-Karenia_brevis.AAC.1